jgi:hypothetical protein
VGGEEVEGGVHDVVVGPGTGFEGFEGVGFDEEGGAIAGGGIAGGEAGGGGHGIGGAIPAGDVAEFCEFVEEGGEVALVDPLADFGVDVLFGVGGDGDVVFGVAAVGDVVIDEEIGAPGGKKAQKSAHFGGVGLDVIAVEVEVEGGGAEAHLAGALFMEAMKGGNVFVAVGVEDGDGEDDDVIEEGGEAAGDEEVAKKHHGGVFAAVFAGVDGVLDEKDRFAGATGGGGGEGAVLRGDEDMEGAAFAGDADGFEAGEAGGASEALVEVDGFLEGAGFLPTGAFGEGQPVVGGGGGGGGEGGGGLHGGGLGEGDGGQGGELGEERRTEGGERGEAKHDC